MLSTSALIGQEDSKWDAHLEEGVHAVAIGQYTAAVEILTQVTQEAHAFPPNDVRRATSALSLATAYQYQGQLERAEAAYLEAREVVETAGASHSWLEGVILNGLGQLRYNQGRWKEAEEFLCEAAERCQKTRSATDACALAATRNLGDVYLIEGRVAESEALFHRLVDLLRQQSPAPNDVLAGALHGLATAYRVRGQYALAEPLLQESLELNKQNGGASPIVGDSLVELASLYRQEHKTDRAEPLLKKAVRIYEDSHDSHIASAYLELGLTAIDDRLYATAEENLQRSLEISQSMHGNKNLSVATAEAALAQAYLGEHNYRKAEPLIREALATARALLGDVHCGFAKFLVIAGTLMEKQKHASEADAYYRQAINIYRRNLSPDHPDLVEAEHQYARFIKSSQN